MMSPMRAAPWILALSLTCSPIVCQAQSGGAGGSAQGQGWNGQRGGQQPWGGSGRNGGGPNRAGRPGGRMRERFQRADTSHDGRLTLQQVQSAQMPNLVRHFDAIDADHKGYITMDDVRAWHKRNMARRIPEGGNVQGGRAQGGEPGAGYHGDYGSRPAPDEPPEPQ